MEDNFWNDEEVADMLSIHSINVALGKPNTPYKAIKEYKESRQVEKQQSIDFKIPADFKETWGRHGDKQQSVENKDWEMVDGYKKCIDGFWTGEVILRTIRRLSDNEAFTIDELTQYGSKIQSFEETKFGLLANMGSFKVPLEDLVKRKNERRPLFTTEDNVPIYEGDDVCLLSTENWLASHPIKACKNPFAGDKNQFKYFSTERAAKEYIHQNKIQYSYSQITNAMYGIVQHEDAVIVMNKLMQNGKN